ncbi:hypothetical protein KUTeg_022351 [Tegillarca granosa]|uniref:Monocarboxylate transporter n=1 Tax=Tegillarca granosa TaxID=220873 RepID=A0ABQ9E6B7_TEGGR|nr:hypothetical protein KUTeg_022351 [Tegillarca granosa]
MNLESFRYLGEEVQKQKLVQGTSTVHYMFVIGNFKSFGIIYTEMLSYFGTGAGNTAWTGTPIATGLLEKLDFRCVTFIGVVFCFVGYLASAFVNNVLLMYLTFGIITGVGYGLIYSPSVTIISFYFSKYRALANGVVAAGSGVGGIVFPYVYRNLIDEFMLQGALMLTAAIFLHLAVTSLCLRQPKEMMRKKKPAKMKPKNNSNDVNKIEGNNLNTNIQEPNKSSDNNNVKGNNSMTVLPAHITVLGIPEQDVAMIVSFIGASEIVARIFLGIITDQTKLKVQKIIALTMMMSGISAIIIPFLRFLRRAVMSLMPSLLIEITGLQRLPKAFGLIVFLMSFSVIFGQPIADILSELRSFFFSMSVS